MSSVSSLGSCGCGGVVAPAERGAVAPHGEQDDRQAPGDGADQILPRLARIVEGTRVLRGSRGEASETVGPLLAAVGG